MRRTYVCLRDSSADLQQLHFLSGEESCARNFLKECSYSNAGYRIAYLINLLSGSNRLDQLEYYSSHMSQFSDNSVNLRGALGPRMLFWVGADQLQEANRKNADVSEAEDFVKPVGINQLKCVFDDLSSGMKTSNIIFRDPSIDFDETNDVPDLLSASFTAEEDELILDLFYSSIEYGTNYVNELWTFIHIAEMMASWLLKKGCRVSVLSRHAYTPDDVIEVEAKFIQDWGGYRNCFNPNPNIFWKDFELLKEFEMHLRQRIKGDVFINPDISVERLLSGMKEEFIDKIEHIYLKDMCYSLMVFALAKYDLANQQEKIRNYLLEIKSELDMEITHHLIHKKFVDWNGELEATIRDIVEEIPNDYLLREALKEAAKA